MGSTDADARGSWVGHYIDFQHLRSNSAASPAITPTAATSICALPLVARRAGSSASHSMAAHEMQALDHTLRSFGERARQEAAAWRELLATGVDPLDVRRRRQAEAELASAKAMTFAQCAKAYIASHEPSWKNDKHRAQWRSTLATYCHSVLGALPVGAIDTALVLKVIEPIWATKPETASRVRGRIEVILNWAKARGHRDGDNPARWRGHLDQLLPAKAKVRRVVHHSALSYRELPALMSKLRKQSSVSARALEFLTLTATRTSETLWATWDEIDVRHRMWIIPAVRMKGGKEHRVPLTRGALAVLKDMAEVRQNEFDLSWHEEGQAALKHGLANACARFAPGHHGARLPKYVQGLGGGVHHIFELRERGSAGACRCGPSRGCLSPWRSLRETSAAHGGVGHLLLWEERWLEKSNPTVSTGSRAIGA